MKDEMKAYFVRLFFVMFIFKIFALLVVKGFVMINVEKLVQSFENNK